MADYSVNMYAHVRPGPNALITVSIDEVDHEFNLQSTIEWVPSSTNEGAHKISILMPLAEADSNSKTFSKTFKFTISAKNNDVLICGLESTCGILKISSQPIWSTPDWQPYDISGHTGARGNADFEGNGSLQILSEQSVSFDATLENTSIRARIL